MTVRFDRQPAPTAAASEVVVDAGDGIVLSGLAAYPAAGAPPRALIVAVPGAGMHGGYYDAVAAPGLSLLALGAELGFTVLALDRPGSGVSADLAPHRLGCGAQADLLLNAVDSFAADHPVGGGVLLVAHSFGLRVAWNMAVDPRASGLLGLDGVGNAIRYSFGLTNRARGRPLPVGQDDRGLSWGPGGLYPPATFVRGALPLVPQPARPPGDSLLAEEALDAIGPRIRVPVRLTYGEHEGYWRIDPEALEEIRGWLPNAPSLAIEIERHVGHNVSLGYAARSYHLKVCAFAEACLLARALG